MTENKLDKLIVVGDRILIKPKSFQLIISNE